MKISEKCLTLHLYRKDETLSAMRWAIATHNLAESVYWALELYDSDMESDAIKMLQYLWITQIGFGSWTSLKTLIELKELDRNEWISLIVSWARIKEHDSTAFHLLIRGTTTPIDWKARFHHSNDYLDLHEALRDTIRRGKLTEAWLIGRGIDYETQWSIIEDLGLQRGRTNDLQVLRKSSLSKTEQCAAAIILVSLDETRWSKATIPLDTRKIPVELQEAIDEWDSEESIRKRRVYSVRPEAITYLCERGEIPGNESFDSDLTENFLQTLLESSCWSAILADYMENGEWKSDDYNEMFYSTYFPSVTDDIPDEWSKNDREKSHARGIGRTALDARMRFINTIAQRSNTIGLWNSTIKGLDSTMEWDSLYDALRDKCNEKLSENLPMKAIKKTFEIV